MEIDKDNLLIISCIFGNQFSKVYQAPLHKNCVFFSNNMELKQEVEDKKWIFFYLPLEISNDILVSSCQSKYIKFLIFLDDYPEFKKYNTILYFDHKVFIKEEHVNHLINISNQENNKHEIIIRRHESQPRTLWDEIEAAKFQERYARNMHTTVELINQKLISNEIKEDIEICNTGLLFYHNYHTIKSMLYEIYNTCIKLEQPECQIIWAIHSQNFLHHIKFIDFYALDTVWKEPFGVINENQSFLSFLLMFFIIVMILILILNYKKQIIKKRLFITR
jgi:hypothetical protein